MATGTGAHHRRFCTRCCGATPSVDAAAAALSEIVDAADRIEVMPGLWLPVASVGHLIALESLARDDDTRPQDSTDLRALVGMANEEDVVLAREAVDLIGARGYARGRDLGADLCALLLANTAG